MVDKGIFELSKINKVGSKYGIFDNIHGLGLEI